MTVSIRRGFADLQAADASGWVPLGPRVRDSFGVPKGVYIRKVSPTG